MTYRGAIVGFGGVAVEGHLPAWRRNHEFELVAVVDPSPERRTLACTLLPGVACYQNLDDCFAHEKIDFVDICSPPLLHDEALLHACDQKVHILCEKPLTLSIDVFARLRRYVVECNRAVFTVHNWQYAPLFQLMQSILDAGTIGEPEYLEWRTLRTRPAGTAQDGLGAWRSDRRIAGGGILIDHGWHLFYLAPWLLHREPAAIAVQLGQEDTQGLETSAQGRILCGEVEVQFHLTWTAERRENAGLMRGTAGSIAFDASSLRISRPGEPIRGQRVVESLVASSYHPEWFAPLVQDFHRALEEPQYREANLRAAATCLALTGQGYESHRRGGVELPILLA
ncbi:MAG: Gfo/Idh/MocA family protein [Candidatus Binatia bacterium]